jgi:hypothetical protein
MGEVMGRAVAGWLSVVALGLLAGCSPTTQYRYSAFVPAVRPVAWDGRTPQTGAVTLEGSVTTAQVLQNYFPQIHDTAVLVPAWTLDGAALVAVSSKVQLGVRGAWAAYQWAQPSATGTMSVPNAPGSWGVGPEMRASFPLDPQKRFALGLVGNVLSYEVPYAEWTLTNTPSPSGTISCDPSTLGGACYTLNDTRTESHLVYSLGLYPSFAIGDGGRYGNVFGLLSATNGFKNDGFTNQPTNGSTVDSVGPIFILGAGYGYRYQMLHATVLAYRPVTDGSSPVNYGFGGQLLLGVDLDVFAKDD